MLRGGIQKGVECQFLQNERWHFLGDTRAQQVCCASCGEKLSSRQTPPLQPRFLLLTTGHAQLISSQKPALFATRSFAVYSRRNMIVKPSLSFAGPREYRWQGLEVPVMMGKRRGTAQIATASLEVCAASNRHKNLLFSQLARSLCTAGQT